MSEVEKQVNDIVGPGLAAGLTQSVAAIEESRQGLLAAALSATAWTEQHQSAPGYSPGNVPGYAPGYAPSYAPDVASASQAAAQETWADPYGPTAAGTHAGSFVRAIPVVEGVPVGPSFGGRY